MPPPSLTQQKSALGGSRYMITPSTIGAAMQDGEDLRFTFERTQSGVDMPYWQQGTAAYDEPEKLAMRMALQHDVRVLEMLDKFWHVYAKDENGEIVKEEYLRVHVKLAMTLIPDITEEEAMQAGEEDWEEDVKGATTMTKECLYDCLFQLVDMWCTSIDGAEYAAFLRKLFRRVTVRYSTSAEGVVSAKPPTPPGRKRWEEFATFRDKRRRLLGL